LTTEQQRAVELAATTSDQMMAWQGVAGAGKTYALNALKELAQGQGYEVRGLAPSAEAAHGLGEALGIETETVAGLLVSQPANHPPTPTLWIVDEAGLLSMKDAHALLRRAALEQARVLLVGDTRQLSAVEAGNPFKSLQAGASPPPTWKPIDGSKVRCCDLPWSWSPRDRSRMELSCWSRRTVSKSWLRQGERSERKSPRII
jgi:hypothetical protein